MISLATLNGSDSSTEDPQNEEISFFLVHLWKVTMVTALLTQHLLSTDFEFPNTNSDQIFSFVLTVSDAEHSISDTINVNYLDNDAPFADAGTDINTCDYEFNLSASQSYDVNWNSLHIVGFS